MLLFFKAPPEREIAKPAIDGIEIVDNIRRAKELKITSASFVLQFLIVKYILRRIFYIYAVIRRGKCVHRITIIGKMYRFPFMNKDDICIAFALTDPEFRNQGLYTNMLRKILCDFRDRDVWIFASESNTTSVSCIKKAGFLFYGTGEHKKIFGLRALGRYVIQNRCP